MRSSWSVTTGIILATVTLAIIGCRQSTEQLPTIPVSGKVTYEDGSPVMAERMEVRFVPRVDSPEEEGCPVAAVGRVDVRNNSFTEMTTYVFGDGAIAGEHDVEVVRFGDEENPAGYKPRIYRGDDVWPSTVTVDPNHTSFHITITGP